MSGKVVIPMTTYTEAPVDAAGLVTERHRAAGPYVETPEGSGVLLLCGAVIIYAKHKGDAPDAPECETCKSLDA